MNHQELKERLSAYLDHELTGTEAQEIGAHLNVCEECARFVREWKNIRTVFFAAPDLQPSNNFVYKVMTQIQPKPVFDFWGCLRWVFPTMALMTVALSLVSVWPANDSAAFELKILQERNLLAVQEVVDINTDWSGLEAL